MAKKKKDFDETHRRNLKTIQNKIDRIFAKAAEEAALIGVNINAVLPDDKIFNFDDYPKTKKMIDELLQELNDSIEGTIVDGVRQGWDLSNDKNDQLAKRVFGKRADTLTTAQKQRYFNNNESALDAFIKRKTNGLNLSDRVWRYSSRFKTEIEMGLDLGIRSGQSAASMARSLRDYLKYPDKLFRRVRDKHGLLRLSQAAKDFHPGRGVYRSSYKNARRLAATESNIAYRTADYLRWQQMDFVVGIEVLLSNNHTVKLQPGETTDDATQLRKDGTPKANAVRPLHDICDELKGRYPKDFKFTGWHPQCRCFAVSILKTIDEVNADAEREEQGEQPTTESVNTVHGTPEAFNEWVRDHADKIKSSKSVPYFIRDNQKRVDEIIKATKKSTNLILPSYSNTSEIDKTFKEINAKFTGRKWFENGDLILTPTNQRGVNGFTHMDGRISLKPDRLESVKSAMGKIGRGRADDITFEEADAMAIFWHEITHNRNKLGNCFITDVQRDVMEMMNEFVARKTLPEFYKGLGCNKTPHPEFINNRESTGYNRRVLGFDYVIQRLNLDAAKVLQSAKNNLFDLSYKDQATTAVQALLDGGANKLKRIDGKLIGKAQLNKIIAFCRRGASTTTIENYLKNEKIIVS